MPLRTFRKLKALAFCAYSLALSGCIGTGGIAPRSSVPQPDTLAVGTAVHDAEQDARWPAQQWWRGYGDEQLNRWISQALAGSPSLVLAQARVRDARALAGAVEASEGPQVAATAALKRRNWPADQFYGPGALAGDTTWDNNAGLGLSWNLDLWGRERNASEQALDAVHQRVAQARQAQLALVDALVQVYIQLALGYAERDIAEATLAQQEQILHLAQTRLAHGIGTQFEVSQAQTPLPETHRQLDALDETITLAGHQLAALAGQGPGAAQALQRPRLRLAADLPLPSTLPAQLLGQRPDVVAARWQVAAQARGIAVAQAGFYPDVNLAGSLGYMATGGGMLEFLTGSTFSYTAGPAFSLPIFDGGRLRGQLGTASAGYDQAVANYQQTLVEALKQVADQLVRRESMHKQAGFAAQSVASAQRTFDLAMAAYQRGLTDYLSVLNAQTALFQQQRVQQQVQAAQLATQATLISALGGGLQAGDDSPKPGALQAPLTPAALSAMDHLRSAVATP